MSAGLCIGVAGAAGAAAADARNTATTAPAEDSGAGRSNKLHICGFSTRLETWRTGAGGVTGYTMAAPVEEWRRRAAAPVEDREPADIGGARSRSHGPAAERPGLGHGKHRIGRTAIQDVPLREF